MTSLLQTYLYTYLETIVGGLLIYFTVTTFQYTVWYVWYKDKYLKHLDTKRTNPLGEIKWSLINLTFQAILAAAIRVALSKNSKLYQNISDYGVPYFILSFFITLLVTEFLVYWVHRLEHDIPFLYRHFHYIHHEFVIVTPYCGWFVIILINVNRAFHPLDAFAQAAPMMLIPFFLPIHETLHFSLTFFLTIWGISIHDNLSFVPSKLFLYAAHHTLHHDKGRKKSKIIIYQFF
jgi:Delta7-sterol 5-desaturase